MSDVGTTEQLSAKPEYLQNHQVLLEIISREYHDEIEKTGKIDNKINLYLTFAATVFVYLNSLLREVTHFPACGWSRDLFIVALVFLATSAALLIYAIIALLFKTKARNYARISCTHAIQQAEKSLQVDFLHELCKAFDRHTTEGRKCNNERLNSVNKTIYAIVASFLLAVIANILLLIVRR